MHLCTYGFGELLMIMRKLFGKHTPLHRPIMSLIWSMCGKSMLPKQPVKQTNFLVTLHEPYNRDSNDNVIKWKHFPTLLAICAGNTPVTGEFPTQRPVRRDFDVFFDLRMNERLSKHWWGWWFETPWCSLWRHFNVPLFIKYNQVGIFLVKWFRTSNHNHWFETRYIENNLLKKYIFLCI